MTNVPRCINPDDGEWCPDLDTVPERLFAHGAVYPIYYCRHESEPVDVRAEAPEWCHRRPTP